MNIMRGIAIAVAVLAALGSAAKQPAGGSSDDGCGHNQIYGLSEAQGVVGGHFSATVSWASVYIETPEFKILDGTLPAGLSFDTQSGRLEGYPSEYGTWTIKFGVRDATKGVCPEGMEGDLYYSTTVTLKIYTSLTE